MKIFTCRHGWERERERRRWFINLQIICLAWRGAGVWFGKEREWSRREDVAQKAKRNNGPPPPHGSKLSIFPMGPGNHGDPPPGMTGLCFAPAGLAGRGGHFCHMGIRGSRKKEKKYILAHIICSLTWSKSNRRNSNNRWLMAQCPSGYCYRLVLFISWLRWP